VRRVGQELALLRERAVEPIKQGIEAQSKTPQFVAGIIDR
jgi:hypothetical protein